MATLITAEAAPRFGQDGFALVGLAAPSRGCSTVSAWRLHAEPGAVSPVHRLTSDEVFVVVRGALEATIGDRVLTARPGDALAIPPGLEFSLANRGDEPCEAVACMAAGGQARIGDGAPFTPPWAA
jgi:mannose-6-phosphate isomerase-like protein (cupin superfamily)